MKRNPVTCALRILAVEDHPDERGELVDFLKRAFPDSTIEEAGSRTEARSLILQASAQESPYDVAVLDLQLPEHVGDVDESRDTTLASLIIEKFGPHTTRLIQWTGYPEDMAIRAFTVRNRIPQSGIVFEVFSKRDLDWPEKMEAFIDRIVAEKAVGRWLDDPYFKQMRDRSLVVTSRPGVTRSPVDIPAYIHALMSVWPALEPHRKKEALTTFEGTEWELKESDDTVTLVHERSAEALADAQENTRIFTDLTESDNNAK